MSAAGRAGTSPRSVAAPGRTLLHTNSSAVSNSFLAPLPPLPLKYSPTPPFLRSVGASAGRGGTEEVGHLGLIPGTRPAGEAGVGLRRPIVSITAFICGLGLRAALHEA